MWAILALYLLLQMSCSVEGKDVMPVLPDDFKASIQTTYVEQDNRVVTMTQYHDYTNNRVRLEREGTDDKKLVDMFFFDELTHYSIETGDEIICALDTIDPLIGSGQPKIDDSGHILHTANMWKESSNYNYNFKGDSEIKFNGKRTMMEKYEGQTQIGSSKYKLSWYWSIKEHPQKPKRFRITKISEADEDTPLDHMYDFLSFVAGPIDSSLFGLDEETSLSCDIFDGEVSTYAANSSTLKTVSFIILLGLGIVAGGLYLRKTYNLGRRDTRGKFMSLSTMELDEDPNGHGYYDGDVTDDVDLSGGEGPLQMGEI